MIISPSSVTTFLELLMMLRRSLLFLSIFIFPPTCKYSELVHVYFSSLSSFTWGNMKMILEKFIPDSLGSSSRRSASRLSRTRQPRLSRNCLLSSLTMRASWFFLLSSSLEGSLSKQEAQICDESSQPFILTTEAEKEKLPSPKNKTGLSEDDSNPSKNISEVQPRGGDVSIMPLLTMLCSL